MARTVGNTGSGFSDINARIEPARDALKQVDTQAIDKALQKLGDLKDMGPLVNAYLRSANDFLNTLSALGDRSYEKEIRAMSAQIDSPQKHYDTHFMARDTSDKATYDHRLPEDFISNSKLSLATEKGLITKDQADAIRFFFFRGVESTEAQAQYYYNASAQEQEKGGKNSGQQQEQDSEQEDWAIEGWDESGHSPKSVQRAMTSPQGQSQANATNDGFTAAPPPPPPPPKQNSSSDYYGAQGYGKMQQEVNYVDQHFSQDDPVYGWFQALFQSENWYRDLSANVMTDLQKVREGNQQILAELAGIDTSSPDGAKKMYILQQRLGEGKENERQFLEHAKLAKEGNDERKEFIKSIMDQMFQTTSAVIRNMRQ